MKISKKVIIPALSTCLGIALVGSISGTVAWYQYSTRTNVAYLGTSAGASGNLQLRIKGQEKWTDRLTPDMVKAYLDGQGEASKVQPITFGGVDKDAALPNDAYLNPVPGNGPYEQWIKASKKNYVSLPLELRYVDRDGIKGENSEEDAECVAKDVYISDLLIQEDYTNAENERKDLSDAIRVHISSYEAETVVTPGENEGDEPTVEHNKKNAINRLISQNGGTTVVFGELDINGDGEKDKAFTGDKYGFGPNNQEEVVLYGEENAVSTAYANSADIISKEGRSYFDQNDEKQDEPEDIYPAIVEEVPNSLKLTKLEYTPAAEEPEEGEDPVEVQPVDKKIGTTVAAPDKKIDEVEDYLNVVMTIWVEGWQKFEVPEEPEEQPQGDEQDPQQGEEQEAEPKVSSIWDGGYIDSMFNVGIQFAVQDELN